MALTLVDDGTLTRVQRLHLAQGKLIGAAIIRFHTRPLEAEKCMFQAIELTGRLHELLGVPLGTFSHLQQRAEFTSWADGHK